VLLCVFNNIYVLEVLDINLGSLIFN